MIDALLGPEPPLYVCDLALDGGEAIGHAGATGLGPQFLDLAPNLGARVEHETSEVGEVQLRLDLALVHPIEALEEVIAQLSEMPEHQVVGLLAHAPRVAPSARGCGVLRSGSPHERETTP